MAAVLGVWPWQRNDLWRDPVTLWADTAAKSPGTAGVHLDVGRALADVGRPREALQAYERASSQDPTRVEALNAQAGVYLDFLGDAAAARRILEQVGRLAPSYLPAINNRGVAQT